MPACFSDALDKRSLFMKNLPSAVTVADIKALSKDIKQVRLRKKAIRRKKKEKNDNNKYTV